MNIQIVGLGLFIREASAVLQEHSVYSTNLARDDHVGFEQALEQAKKGTAVCLIQANLKESDLTEPRYLEAFSLAFRVHHLELTQRTRPEVKFFALGTGEQLHSLKNIFDIFCS